MVRFKQRYLLVQVHSEVRGVTQKDVYSAISGRVMQVLGVWGYGVAKASLTIKYWNDDTGTLILRVTRSFVRPVWLAVSRVTDINGRRGVLEVLHCGATIRAVKKVLLRMLQERRVAES